MENALNGSTLSADPGRRNPSSIISSHVSVCRPAVGLCAVNTSLSEYLHAGVGGPIPVCLACQLFCLCHWSVCWWRCWCGWVNPFVSLSPAGGGLSSCRLQLGSPSKGERAAVQLEAQGGSREHCGAGRRVGGVCSVSHAALTGPDPSPGLTPLAQLGACPWQGSDLA